MQRLCFPARTSLLVLGLVVWEATPAVAQEGAREEAPQRAQSFQAVEGAVEEDVPGGPLMIASYGLIWVLVLLYVVRLARQQQRTQAELRRVEGLLDKASAEQG